MKVESQLKTNALVDNICVYASSSKTHTVAILVPVKDQLEKFAAKIEKDYEAKSLEELCVDPALVEVNSILGTVHKTNSNFVESCEKSWRSWKTKRFRKI